MTALGTGKRTWQFTPTYSGGMLRITPAQWTIIGIAGLIGISLTFTVGLGTAFSPLVALGTVAGALGFVRVSDRRAEKWVLPVTKGIIGTITGRNRWTTKPAADRVDPPPTVKGWRIFTVVVGTDTANPTNFGVLANEKERAWVAVARVRTPGFYLLDDPDKENRINEWGNALGAFAEYGNPVAKVQWLERIALHHDTRPVTHFDNYGTNETSAATESYRALLDTALHNQMRHEVFVALRIDHSSASQHINRNGGGDAGAASVLVDQVDQLAKHLPDLGVEPVDGEGLHHLVRTQFEPFAEPGDGDAWPTATHTKWQHYHTDSTFHITSWIAGLPREIGNPGFLGRLLLDPALQTPRTVSLTMDITEPDAALRRLESIQTGRQTTNDWMADKKFRFGARQQREGEALDQREQELAGAYANVRFYGFVTVTGETLEDARDANTKVTAAVRRLGGTRTRVLTGEQDTAFAAAALPMGKI